MRCRKDKEGLKRLLDRSPEYQRVDADTLELLSVMLNIPRIWEERIKYLDQGEEKEEYNMCQALQEWIEEERKAGEAEGKAEGKAEAVLYLLEEKGEISEELRAAIMSQKDTDVLHQCLLEAAGAVTVAEFREEVKKEICMS